MIATPTTTKALLRDARRFHRQLAFAIASDHTAPKTKTELEKARETVAGIIADLERSRSRE